MLPQSKTNVLQKVGECLESCGWRSFCKRISSAACGRVVEEGKKKEGTLKLRPLCAAPFLKKALWVHRPFTLKCLRSHRPSAWFLRAKPARSSPAAEEGAFALRVGALWRPPVCRWSPALASPRVLLGLSGKDEARCSVAGVAARHQLEVEVTNPVDYVEEQEGGGEEDPGVGIQLPDVDVDAPSPPAALFTLLVAAEEAGAVFAIQTLVKAVVLVVVPEEGVTHWHHGPWGRRHGEG